MKAQLDPEFLIRLINFWVILGFAFFIAIWIIQAVHTGLLKKDIVELQSEIMELKSKLYDFNREATTTTKTADDSESSVLEE